MQIVIDIPSEMYSDIKFGKDGYSNYVHTAIRNGTPLPDNPTNGDMIETLFPPFEVYYDVEYDIIVGSFDKTHRHNFDLDWWNAPYKTKE